MSNIDNRQSIIIKRYQNDESAHQGRQGGKLDDRCK